MRSEVEVPGRRTGRYRHITFADAIDGAERAVDLAPAQVIEFDQAIDADEGTFLQWLFRRGGLDVRHYRTETLARRLPACLRKLRVANVGLARSALERNPQLIHDALGAMLIGVTGFFRDTTVFDELAGQVLPDLLRRKRLLRVWSVACSEGQELYSVAMLLAELGAGGGVELLGTDCRVEATRAAALGAYDLNAVRAVSAERLARHFDCLPASGATSDDHRQRERTGLWRVKAPLRAMTRWRTADVLTTIEPGPWDLILCRNVAMYLRCNASAALWNQLAGAIARGGYMVLGKAERAGGTSNLSGIGQYLYRRSD
jgi:chemotaxis methyl-accepting protein methylase